MCDRQGYKNDNLPPYLSFTCWSQEIPNSCMHIWSIQFCPIKWKQKQDGIKILPNFDKRNQVTKVTFLVKEQNVSVISIDVNGISWCLYPTYLVSGWVFMHKIWTGRRSHCVKYKNINNSDLDGMSLASFCQSRAEYYLISVMCDRQVTKMIIFHHISIYMLVPGIPFMCISDPVLSEKWGEKCMIE